MQRPPETPLKFEARIGRKETRLTTSTQWLLAREAAERYQSVLTPAILGPFAEALVDHATVQPGEWIVDVGCGTGAAARHAAVQMKGTGRVTGIDVNGGMLAVARSLPTAAGAPIDWREANASQLPLDDQSVDVVLCAQVLQFIPDKVQNLHEMRRILQHEGRLALSLWCNIEENAYFDALVEAVARHVGAETAAGLGAAFALSGADEIRHLLKAAGYTQIQMDTIGLDLSLPPLDEFVPRHIGATPMAAGFNQADEGTQQRVIHEVVETCRSYTTADGVTIPFRSHAIIAR